MPRLADLLVSGCSNSQHAVAALISDMCRVTPGTARVFADLGCVERVVGLLSSGVCCVQEEAALALAQLLLLDEEGEDDEEWGGGGVDG